MSPHPPSPASAPPAPTALPTATAGSPPRPTFLIVGVAKAGTTTLYNVLRAHPEVFMPAVKEPGFFAHERGGPRAVRTWEDYLGLFAEAGSARAIGEATPYYFHYPKAMERIVERLPGVRVVVILRHPVERALSHYVMLANSGVAIRTEPFASFFRRHLGDVASWSKGEGEVPLLSLASSFYAADLKRWLRRLGPERVLPLFTEDLTAARAPTTRTLYAFVGVDPAFEPDVEERYNAGRALPRSGAFQRWLFRPSPLKQVARSALPTGLRVAAREAALALNQGHRPALTAAERAAFAAVYRDDVREVERLTGRDLSAWLV